MKREVSIYFDIKNTYTSHVLVSNVATYEECIRLINETMPEGDYEICKIYNVSNI